MFKIVHIITRFVNGGADENTLLTCNAQAAAGHEVVLIYGADHTARMVDGLDPRVTKLVMPSLVRTVAPVRDIVALVQTIIQLRRLRPDVIHTHTSKAGIIGRLAALAAPEAVVVHGVHILPFSAQRPVLRFVYLALEKLTGLVTDAYIDVSEGMKTECLAHGLGTDDRHRVIASGMDVAKFRDALPANDVASIGAGAFTAPIRIGYVAVLERRKRHRELFEAVTPLLRRHPHVHLVLAGEGPERAALEALAEDKGVANRIHLLGFRGDVEAVLAACDICVFASEREGLPRSLVQYGLAGKPIVASHLPGIERVLRHEDNGYVVGADAFDEFAARLETLVGSAVLRDAMAARSRALDLSDWDARRMTDRIDAVYAQLLSGRSRGSGRIEASGWSDLT
ncbi:MAG TPA: glycosyltransferase [Parvibaculum sp.]|jgi:glycosyltransferase involved in cell wall biosynthesis